MTLLPETRAALARYDEWVARTMKSPDAIAVHTRRIKRKTASVMRRLRNMLLGAMGVALAATLYGIFVSPLGFGGLMLTLLAIVGALVLFASWPGEPEAKLEKLPETPLQALPSQVEEWVAGQQKLLPAPALNDINRLMAQLHRLEPELKTLNPTSVEAEDARRLMADHLPRLVQSYTEIPQSHRNTPEATTRFREGLKVVGDELTRLTDDLARDRLKALEVEGRFLESRYSPKS